MDMAGVWNPDDHPRVREGQFKDKPKFGGTDDLGGSAASLAASLEAMSRAEGMRAARGILLRGDGLDGMKAAEIRRTVQVAYGMASDRTRNEAIANSPHNRYLPPESLARSLRARRPQDACAILDAIHAKDANASAAVIRAGFPNDKSTAMTFFNRHKSEGDRGRTARHFLRLKFVPTRGVPTSREVSKAVRDYRALDHDPLAQAERFWDECYGVTGGPGDRGNGNKAMMIAYNRGLTREAAVTFLGMVDAARDNKTLDSRKAHSKYMSQVAEKDKEGNVVKERNPKTGRMVQKKRAVPRERLSAMRSHIHAMYAISDDEVQAASADFSFAA